MLRVLHADAYSSREELRRALLAVFHDADLRHPDRRDRLEGEIDAARPGLLVVGLESWAEIGVDGVQRLFERHPDMRVLLTVPAGLRDKRTDNLAELLALGDTDFIDRGTSFHLLVHRLRRFLRGVQETDRPESLLDLHDPDSGRLDARRIASFLDIPLSKLAVAIGRRYGSVHRTPDAESLQPLLLPYRELISRALVARGSPIAVRVWLRMSRDATGGRQLDALYAGQIDAVIAAATRPDPPT